jgi:hypothetical protein
LADRFGFLTKLEDLSPKELEQYASKLKQIYKDDLGDATGQQLAQFAAFYKTTEHKTSSNKIRDMMDMFYDPISGHGMKSTFPYVEIILRIYLSLMVTNCAGERSFSTLKRIKNNLRSTMGQTRLNSLAILCIESELLNEINVEEIIKNFAFKKARKVHIV